MNQHPRLLALLLIAGFLSFGGVLGYAFLVNQQRVSDIQASRVASCEQTYEGVREVLLPFFPPEEKRTEEQQKNIDKLDRTVNRLKARCEEQVNQGGTDASR